MNKKSLPKIWIAILIIICLLGAFLIFFDLGRKSLWYDEVFSASHSQKTLKEIVFYHPEKEQMWNNAHPILHYILMHFSFKFGTSDFFARLPSALFGVFLIPLVFYAGREFFDFKTGVIAAFFAAISGLLVAHAQEARMYTQLAFFSLLSLIFIFKILYNEKDKKIDWIIFILASIANLYTHTFATLVLGTEIIFTCVILSVRIVFNQDRKRSTHKLLVFLSCIITIALISSPEFLKEHNLIKQHMGGGKLSRGVKFDYSFLTKIFSQFTIPEYPAAMLIYTISFLCGLIFSIFRRPGRFIIFILWTFLPIGILLIFKAKHFFNVRYIIFILPVYLICAAYGIKTFFSIIDKCIKKIVPIFKRIDFILILLIALAFVLIQINYPIYKKFYTGEKDNWKAAAQYLKNNADEKDLILADHGAFVCLGYYLKINKMNNLLIYDPELINKSKPGHFWFTTVNTGPEIFPDCYRITDRKRYGSLMVNTYHLQRFDKFRLEKIGILSETVSPKEQFSVIVSFYNPDTLFHQFAVVWLSIEDTEKNIDPLYSVTDIILLNPLETVAKDYLLKAPSNTGKYRIIFTYSAPQYTFFPGYHRFFYQIGKIKKDKLSPSFFIIKAEKKKQPQGYLMYGPYDVFPAGNYKASFLLAATHPENEKSPYAVIDIVSEGGKIIFGKLEITDEMIKKSDIYNIFELEFNLKKETELEFRMLRLSNVDLKCGGVILQQNNPKWDSDPERNKKEIEVIDFVVEDSENKNYKIDHVGTGL